MSLELNPKRNRFGWFGGKEKRLSPPQSGSSGESPNYDALEIALSLENPLMRHSTANLKP